VGSSGGDGADVVIRATKSQPQLRFSQFVFNGGDGADASGKGKSGRRGKEKVIMVPCGTVVKDVTRVRCKPGEREGVAV
jgi:GTPase